MLIPYVKTSNFRRYSFRRYSRNTLDVIPWTLFGLLFESKYCVLGHSAALFFCGSISHTATSLLLALPQFLPMLQNKTYVVTCLCLAGFSSATTFAPGYISLEETAHLRGYTGPQESLKLTVGIWSNFVMCR